MQLRDRVWLTGHDREGVVVAVVRDEQGEAARLSVAVLNARGDRVVYDLAPGEVAPVRVQEDREES
jgi:hypothetical protein